jgi:hypothetical protein
MNASALMHWATTAPTWQPAALGGVGLVSLAWLAKKARKVLTSTDPADLITAVIALSATAYAATGTWKYLTDAMHYGTDLRVFLVAVLEGAQIAEALRSRKNIRETGAAGVDGIGLWVLTGISAALSTSVAGNVREALGRAIIPAVGAWLWERALAPQRRAARARRGGPVRWRITPERVFVWLRLADAVDTDVAKVESARKVVKFLRRSDRERDGWRWPLTASARAYRSRMGLFADGLRHGDPRELYAELQRTAYTDARTRLGIAESEQAPAAPEAEQDAVPVVPSAPAPESVAPESSAPSAPDAPSQSVELITPDDSEFAEVIASLPPAPVTSANGRKRVAAASGPARRQARVTASIGVDREEAVRLWRESRDSGAPLSSRALAARTGMSQSTAARLIAEIRAEDGQAAA